MLYCSSECGSISIMRAVTHNLLQHVCSVYIHFMCAYVYLHLHLFVIPKAYLLKSPTNLGKWDFTKLNYTVL